MRKAPKAKARLRPSLVPRRAEATKVDAKAPVRLLVGLGNPGRRYEGTRHNVGFDAVDRLLSAARGRWNRATASAIGAHVELAGHSVTLLKPLSFMNLSGGPVGEWAEALSIDRTRVLVYYDDIALPLGRLRIRAHGSAGGHRGLGSILETLGGENVPRLRIGIGPDTETSTSASESESESEGLADFVLSHFARDEEATVDEALDRVVAATRTILTEGLAKAQSLYNAAGSAGR